MLIGEFDGERSPALEELGEYAAAFSQMEVRLLPAYHPHDLGFEPRKNPHSGQGQILTGSVIRFLGSRLPPDASCLLGVTMEDLCPDPKWNFVFGQASLNDRVGVCSFARDDPAYGRDPRPQDYRELIQRRNLKTLAHETGRMSTARSFRPRRNFAGLSSGARGRPGCFRRARRRLRWPGHLASAARAPAAGKSSFVRDGKSQGRTSACNRASSARAA